MDKKRVIHELIMIFWLFIIGSIVGYIYEMIVVLFKKGYFESRQGLIYGPFTPVYGIGAIVYYMVLSRIESKNKTNSNSIALSTKRFGIFPYLLKIFLITAILGGITEYISSFVQEKAFGTISWDYSHLRFNLNGRTSLMHCTYWGIAGIMYVTLVEPLLQKIRTGIKRTKLKVVTIVLSIFMVFDITISCIAAERQEERRKNINAESPLDTFLDIYYPDEYMDKIFANKKEK